MASVIVLTPNGRRQTVKVTPNTTVLQILEEACNKHSLNADEYDLKHHKKILDTTNTFRFSGLPNNATLELVEAATKRQEREVVLGVQLEDGKRLMGNFTPSHTLLEVLTKLCPTEITQEKNPVVIYMRQELAGVESLQSTSLKKLGLTGGRAMLRLIHRFPELLKQQANVSAPLPIKQAEEKPYVRQFQKLSPERELAYQAKQTPPPLPMPPSKLDLDEPVKGSMNDEPVKVEKPQQDFVGIIKSEKRKQTDGQKVKSRDYKSADVVEKDDFAFLGERNAILFSLETAQTIKSEDLPDDFYELSISDIKKLFRDIKKKRLEMETTPLMTSALRTLEESKKQLRNLNQYKKAVIRVQFPTRLVLQGTFIPSETIGHVMDFVRSYLTEPELEFYLYLTPPKKILARESTLLEADCVPGALMYFGSVLKREQFLKKEVLDKLTSTSVASSVASRLRAENRRNVPRPHDDLSDLSLTENNVAPGTSCNDGSANSPVDYDYDKKSVRSSTPPEKVPKWFKPTK